ncbi:hypothetical protein Plhal304r1_c017g0061001 [Plasmopara halstedii]
MDFFLHSRSEQFQPLIILDSHSVRKHLIHMYFIKHFVSSLHSEPIWISGFLSCPLISIEITLNADHRLLPLCVIAL